MRRILLAGFIVLSCSGASWAGESATTQFTSFCEEWMQKLAVRERDNQAAIRWQAGPDGVLGEYVGYSREHSCQVKPTVDPKAVPIGKIVYRELVYRKVGASKAEAENEPPQPIEATEVTEIFRYSGGKWVY